MFSALARSRCDHSAGSRVRTSAASPPETPGEGAASGRESRHSGRGGTARYGTVRHGTGVTTGGTEHSRHAHRHNVQRKRTRHRTHRWKRHPAALGPRSLQPPGPPPIQQIATTRAGGLARRGGGCVPPVLAGTKARWRMCSGGEVGPGGVSVPRAIYTLYKYLQREERRGRRPAGGTPASALVIGGERRWLCAGPGLSSLRLSPASPSHSRRPTPSLGHRQSSRRGICHKAWASRGSRVLDHKCINLLRAFSTAMD
ncbi:uncharacterized protein LOC134557894 [Prinia subflava]|uniref:uncharacterized protein LOC134557894 n=1 Tax=Prinia subflava TaxID=208062 RepID=UPI002FE3BACB